MLVDASVAHWGVSSATTMERVSGILSVVQLVAALAMHLVCDLALRLDERLAAAMGAEWEDKSGAEWGAVMVVRLGASLAARKDASLVLRETEWGEQWARLRACVSVGDLASATGELSAHAWAQTKAKLLDLDCDTQSCAKKFLKKLNKNAN